MSTSGGHVKTNAPTAQAAPPGITQDEHATRNTGPRPKNDAFARAAVRAAGELRRKNKKIFAIGITLMRNNFPLAPARG